MITTHTTIIERLTHLLLLAALALAGLTYLAPAVAERVEAVLVGATKAGDR